MMYLLYNIYNFMMYQTAAYNYVCTSMCCSIRVNCLIRIIIGSCTEGFIDEVTFRHYHKINFVVSYKTLNFLIMLFQAVEIHWTILVSGIFYVDSLLTRFMLSFIILNIYVIRSFIIIFNSIMSSGCCTSCIKFDCGKFGWDWKFNLTACTKFILDCIEWILFIFVGSLLPQF